MKITGRVVKLGHHIDTDVIIPARYLNSSAPEHLARYCFQDQKLDIQPGSILLAGKNFGCGSSREHAPLSMKGAGISCVIAISFARIFYRNAINIGLPILISREAYEMSREGDTLQVLTDLGKIENLDRKSSFSTNPLPSFIHQIMDAGGLMEYVVRRIHHAP